MKNTSVTEAHGKKVDVDQDFDNEAVKAASGGVAVNGDVYESAVNTGVNTGIMAGKDVDLDDSIVGDKNLQINESNVGAFAAGSGDATNAVAGPDGNVNFGGQLIDTDTGGYGEGGDVQVVTGDFNDVRGEVDVDLKHVDGPINLAAGDGNRQNALEDNSKNIEDSFKIDASQEDSNNKLISKTKTVTNEDNDTHEKTIVDSFNKSFEADLDVDYSDHSSYTEPVQEWSTGDWGDDSAEWGHDA